MLFVITTSFKGHCLLSVSKAITGYIWLPSMIFEECPSFLVQQFNNCLQAKRSALYRHKRGIHRIHCQAAHPTSWRIWRFWVDCLTSAIHSWQWPNDPMTQWPNDPMTQWPNDPVPWFPQFPLIFSAALLYFRCRKWKNTLADEWEMVHPNSIK